MSDYRHTIQAVGFYIVGLALAFLLGIGITDLNWVLKTFDQYTISILAFMISGFVSVPLLSQCLRKHLPAIPAGVLTALSTFAISLTLACSVNAWIYQQSPSSSFYSYFIGPFFWVGIYGTLPAILLGAGLGWIWRRT